MQKKRRVVVQALIPLMAIELYAEAFEQMNALDKLEGFASFYGADFYGLARNSDTITLSKEEWSVSESYSLGSNT